MNAFKWRVLGWILVIGFAFVSMRMIVGLRTRRLTVRQAPTPPIPPDPPSLVAARESAEAARRAREARSKAIDDSMKALTERLGGGTKRR